MAEASSMPARQRIAFLGMLRRLTAWANRFGLERKLSIGLLSDDFLLLQWAAVSWAPLAKLLGSVPLTAGDWLVIALACVWPVALLEALKVLRRD